MSAVGAVRKGFQRGVLPPLSRWTKFGSCGGMHKTFTTRTQSVGSVASPWFDNRVTGGLLLAFGTGTGLGYQIGRRHGRSGGYESSYHDGNNWGISSSQCEEGKKRAELLNELLNFKFKALLTAKDEDLNHLLKDIEIWLSHMSYDYDTQSRVSIALNNYSLQLLEQGELLENLAMLYVMCRYNYSEMLEKWESILQSNPELINGNGPFLKLCLVKMQRDKEFKCEEKAAEASEDPSVFYDFDSEIAAQKKRSV